MKALIAITLTPLFMLLGGQSLTNMTVDITESTVTWKGYKVTGSHEGTIALKSGELTYDTDGGLTGGSIVIDMTTIACTDLKAGGAAKLEGHLKSDDFFGVANYPEANLTITNVAAKGTPGDYKITADLTIKETTKPVKFYANIADKDGKRVATADLKIDRTEYDVRYGSGSFFDNLGDKTIYDEFDISVQLVSAAE